MSMYDPENPQHMDYLSRAKAASRRTTEMFEDAEIRDRVREILARDQGVAPAEPPCPMRDHPVDGDWCERCEEAATTSLYAERNGDRVDHGHPEIGLAPTDADPASKGHQMLRQEGGLNPPPRAIFTPSTNRRARAGRLA